MQWWDCLNEVLRDKIVQIAAPKEITELHVRAGRCASLVVNGENRRLDYYATAEELGDVLTACCRGSVYAYRETIREGYVPLCEGARLGLAGHAVREGDEVVAVTDLTALCFRIPHRVSGVAGTAYNRWLQTGGGRGILVVAPPGGGKTTFLKDFICMASTGTYAKRVAVVDTREELVPDTAGDFVSVLYGYPRGEGLEIALRTLSPEVLVCDEIGTREMHAVNEIIHCGIPLIASIHGSALTQVGQRDIIEAWLSSGAFGFLITIGMKDGQRCIEVKELEC